MERPEAEKDSKRCLFTLGSTTTMSTSEVAVPSPRMIEPVQKTQRARG